jgi:hypothetical protein
MQVSDSAGRIASIQAFGHSFSTVGLDHLRYGAESSVVTSADGIFGFSGVPDGSYRLLLTPERLIHAFAGSGDLISVQNGAVQQIAAGFQRVRSPWNNAGDSFDVDENLRVEPLDALLILTEIGRGGSRVLRDPSQIDWFIDTNDDGELSPLDALWVLTEIGRRNRDSQGEQASFEDDLSLLTDNGQPHGATDALFAAWSDPDDEKKRLGLWDQDTTGQSGDAISTILG